MQKTIDECGMELVAQWFVIGFVKAWTLAEVLEACGVKVDTKNFKDVPGAVPFWPSTWFPTTPVRSVVAADYPKLNDFLLANADKPQKLAATIPQVARLKRKDNARNVLNNEDERYEVRTGPRDMKRAEAGRAAMRDQRKSGGRSAWNVCKK